MILLWKINNFIYIGSGSTKEECINSVIISIIEASSATKLNTSDSERVMNSLRSELRVTSPIEINGGRVFKVKV